MWSTEIRPRLNLQNMAPATNAVIDRNFDIAGSPFGISWNMQLPSSSDRLSPTTVHPLVAQGDWTKNLVQLAKTAELK